MNSKDIRKNNLASPHAGASERTLRNKRREKERNNKSSESPAGDSERD